MQREFEGLDANGTLTPAEFPKRRKTMGAKYIYRWMINQHREVVKAKATSVPLNVLHRKGIGYLNTFSPPPVASSIRSISVLDPP